MKPLKYIAALICAFIVGSCGPDEVIFDHPFIYIENKSHSDVSQENCMGVATAVYNVYLSSKTLNRDVNVNFEVIAGDGLMEGVDYVLLTNPAVPLLFPSGNYQKDIRIQWLANKIDTAKDNTLTIVLTKNDADITLGFPGPDEKFKQHVITKVLID